MIRLRSKSRLATAHRELAKRVLLSNGDPRKRLDKYNSHMAKARALEAGEVVA